MAKRFAAIWFRHLTTDWLTRRQPSLKDMLFVLAAPQRGRMIIRAASQTAEKNGIYTGMVVADCRAILPSLQVFDEQPGQWEKLLNALGEWCMRYTPVAAIDPPDGLILDISGCAHLWGGEEQYIQDIQNKLSGYGYDVRIAVADTIGVAWAIVRYGKDMLIVPSGKQVEALLPLPPAALRLEESITARLIKLGFYTIRSFINTPRRALRRRFGPELLCRLDQALGQEIETIQPIVPVEPYQERLPSLEPICTANGIAIALERLLEKLCSRLAGELKGLRKAIFKCYRVDGNMQTIAIGTNRPSRNITHLLRLFELKIPSIEPDLGIELFLLEAPVTEDLTPEQEMLWDNDSSHDEIIITELLDKIAGKFGTNTIHRYLPDEHYSPERCIRLAASLQEQPQTAWRRDQQRPVQLLTNPEPIEVTVPIPDYPPMLFIYKSKLHHITKADGPERIEREWWLETGETRDYYCVEDEQGARYWLFRLGHYATSDPQWFIHGFFA